MLTHLGDAALMAFGMAWQTLWSLILGFSISALLQSTVSADQMKEALGRDGPKEIALAAAAGAASSSCSYASAAITRTLFKKGAALACSLAFMIASTNLVLELGLILLVLLGWKFMLGQWIGGVVLVAIMSVIVKATAPKTLVDEARNHEETGKGHNHMAMQADGDTWVARATNPKTRIYLAQSFAMEWQMLWKDLAIGFVVGGLVSAFVPAAVWKTIFLGGSSSWLAVPVDAIVGPIIAIVTFVCSVGNIPLAAILWAGGASFGGVLAFIYADLIVLPLLDTYRRYFGWRMAAYLFVVLFVTMALAGMVVDVGFHLAGLTPAPNPNVKAEITHFALNYTFWLNLIFGAWAAYLLWLNHKHPMDHSHMHGHHHDGHHQGGHAQGGHDHGAHQGHDETPHSRSA